MARKGPTDDWPDFTRTAQLQFWSLPPEMIEAFGEVFPDFCKHPQRPSATIDIVPIRNDPKRWRLKVAGYRAIYQLRHGRPLVEAILPRTVRTYQDFEQHRKRL